jgi:hypothetical protein
MILKDNNNQGNDQITRNIVVLHFHKYFGPSEETLRFPEAKSPSLRLELEWV